MKKNLAIILSILFPIASFGAASIKKEIGNEVEKSPKKEKSVYERLTEKGRGEIKESADSGRTGGGAKTTTLGK